MNCLFVGCIDLICMSHVLEWHIWCDGIMIYTNCKAGILKPPNDLDEEKHRQV